MISGIIGIIEGGSIIEEVVNIDIGEIFGLSHKDNKFRGINKFKINFGGEILYKFITGEINLVDDIFMFSIIEFLAFISIEIYIVDKEI